MSGATLGDPANAQRIIELEAKLLGGRRSTSPRVVWDRAEGDTVYGADGRTYLDFTSGVLVANLGHSHPVFVRAIQEQASRVINCYDGPHPLRVEAAEALLRHLPMPLERVFFQTTGAEAIETAIKLARAFTGRYEVISFQGGFHGKSYMSMAVGGNHEIRGSFGPFMPGVTIAPFPYCYRCPFGHDSHDTKGCPLHTRQYLEWLRHTATSNDIAAVVVETYQGAGGCVPPPEGFLAEMREFCDEHGALLVLDEIQSGFGRTGKWFAFEHSGVLPDVVCVAKGLANGVPTSAVITNRAVAVSVSAGQVSSTYGGNPLSCAAVKATVEIMETEDVVENCASLSPIFRDGLERLRSFWPVGDVRAIGLVCGVEFVRDRAGKEPWPEIATMVVDEAARLGLNLIYPTGLFGNVLRAMPPLTISRERLELGLTLLNEAVGNVTSRVAADAWIG